MTKEDFLTIAEKKINGKILYKDYTENENVIFLDIIAEEIEGIKAIYSFYYNKFLNELEENKVFLNGYLLDAIKKL